MAGDRHNAGELLDQNRCSFPADPRHPKAMETADAQINDPELQLQFRAHFAFYRFSDTDGHIFAHFRFGYGIILYWRWDLCDFGLL